MTNRDGAHLLAVSPVRTTALVNGVLADRALLRQLDLAVLND